MNEGRKERPQDRQIWTTDLKRFAREKCQEDQMNGESMERRQGGERETWKQRSEGMRPAIDDVGVDADQCLVQKWFVPVGSEPTLALKTMTCKKEVVWFPKFMTVQKKGVIEVHTLRSGHRRLGENGETRPIIAAQVPVLRHSQCEGEHPRWLARRTQ